MTEGKIIKSIIIYAIPLILGNFMQQLYSTVDSFVVGNYVGATALAAVGCQRAVDYFCRLLSGGIRRRRYFDLPVLWCQKLR